MKTVRRGMRTDHGEKRKVEKKATSEILELLIEPLLSEIFQVANIENF